MEKCKGVNSPMIHKPTQNDCPERRFKELQIKESTATLSKEQIEVIKESLNKGGRKR